MCIVFSLTCLCERSLAVCVGSELSQLCMCVSALRTVLIRVRGGERRVSALRTVLVRVRGGYRL